MKRFTVFAALALFGAAILAAPSAPAETDVLSRDRVLRDQDIPAAGNPKGNLTVVEFFDYQCPYCKALHPELKKAVDKDGNIRLVYKNWPIFGPVSVYAARMTLAAKYQGKYVEAHEALITAPTKLDEARVDDLLAKAGINVDRVKQDLKNNAKTIDAALARTEEQANAFGFRGTPSFIFGTFRFFGALDAEGFAVAFADARKAQQSEKKR
jgi:protein-disulfide isomerase